MKRNIIFIILFTLSISIIFTGCKSAPDEESVDAYIQKNYPGLSYHIDGIAGTGEMETPYTAVISNDKEYRVYQKDDQLSENVYAAVYGDRYDQEIENMLSSIGINATVRSEFNDYVTVPVTSTRQMQRLYKFTDIFIPETADYELIQSALSDYIGHYEIFISENTDRKNKEIIFSFDIDNK